MVLDSDSMMTARTGNLCGFIISRARTRLPNREENEMKKLPLTVLSVFLLLSLNAAAQNQNVNTNSNGATNGNKSTTVNRGPVFRASADQIKQAQVILKQRGFYSSEQTGKLDANTRAGLRKYQQAESMKVTGTLNKSTLGKMGITLTEKQKAMP